MNDALYIAATGMQSQQLSVDTIANNMANVTTPGFKRGRVNFQDLMYRDASPTSTNGTTDPAAMVSVARGSGVSVGSLLKFFGAGELKPSDNPMDLAIRGDGFLEVQLADGSTGFWRGGTLQVTPEGWLATAEGSLLKPQVQVGRDGKAWAIASDGRVTGADRAGHAVELGRLELHTFSNAAGLKPLGDGLYRPTEASGESIVARPGTDGAATLVQGAQEQSNVKLIDEMVNLMVAQRAYEMNVKVIQAADEMLGMSNNLRK
jgi:flagellar basal-body rod protein FlgG